MQIAECRLQNEGKRLAVFNLQSAIVNLQFLQFGTSAVRQFGNHLPSRIPMPPPPSSGPQTLLIDADDTLWENNIYFERAIAEFISFLNHQRYTREQVREVLNDVERHNIVKHGNGLHSFAHALVDTFERLSVDPVTPEMHAQVHAIAHKIAAQPAEIIAGVPETLDYLAARHHLILMTKEIGRAHV